MNVVRPFADSALRASTAALVLAALAGCTDEGGVGAATEPVIYTVDDRVDVYESTSALFQGIARDSIVAMVPTGLLLDNGDGTFTPNPFTLAEYIAYRANASSNDDLPDGQTLCPGERFATQPTIGNCSGTLIDDDLVLTAAHCTEDMACPDADFVFDYLYSANGVLETIETDDVYRCAKVVARRLDPDETGQDYAIVRLDRPVVGRTPAAVDVGFGVATGDPVVVVGFPTGVPAKIDEGGVVIDDRAEARDFFTATTDTFSGNSGSGVFDTSGTLVGVLVRGAVDYVSNGSCITVNVIDVGAGFGGGEDVTYATNAIEALCDVSAEGDTSLCANGAPIGSPGVGGGGAPPAPRRNGDCAASPGASTPGGLVSMLLAAAALARRRRQR